jgi:hypothetical protein
MSSELTRALSQVVPLLPSPTRRDLRALLAHHLAVPDPVRERGLRLDLLCELLERDRGEIPSVRTYERERHVRPPKHHPSAAALSRRYSGWLRAVRAATWLSHGGIGQAPVREVRTWQHAYDRHEVISLLLACRDAIGQWPEPALYGEWASVRRATARAYGDGLGRVASLSVMRRLFGGFVSALDAAKAADHV